MYDFSMINILIAQFGNYEYIVIFNLIFSTLLTNMFLELIIFNIILFLHFSS